MLLSKASNARAPGGRPAPAKPRPAATAIHPKLAPKGSPQPVPKAGPKPVRPLIVQAIAKQMQKQLMQRNLLTSPSESAALQPGTPQAKQAGKK